MLVGSDLLGPAAMTMRRTIRAPTMHTARSTFFGEFADSLPIEIAPHRFGRRRAFPTCRASRESPVVGEQLLR